MLIIAISSFLLLNAIFWGLIPVGTYSPHQLLLNFFNIDYKPDLYFHLFIGTSFYILAVLLIHKGESFFTQKPIHSISSQ
jgi:hypothetical protein